jgi:hypothetical protein
MTDERWRALAEKSVERAEALAACREEASRAWAIVDLQVTRIAEAVAAERARIRAAMEAYFSSDEPPVVSTEADVLAIIEGGDDA